jgi:hypothetical protein
MDAFLRKAIPDKIDGFSFAERSSRLGERAAGPTDWKRRQTRNWFAALHGLYALDLEDRTESL